MSEKCGNCSKKSLILVPCKCDTKVCLKCRDPQNHSCKYDFQKNNKKNLEDLNPKIQSKKLESL